MRRIVLASLLVAVAAAVGLVAGSARADLVPIVLDGWFDDWSAVAPLATDPAGDAGTSGIDFGDIVAANDQDWFFIRFTTGIDVQPDEQQDIRLYLDTDMNASTGTAYNGIGADLVWNLGQRDGDFRGTSISHPDIGLQVGPTVSSTQFELALRRSATPAGQTLFPGSTVRFVLRDGASGGDVTDPVTYTFAAGSIPVPSLDLNRADPSNIRLATWNVQSDGLFNGGSDAAAQDRLLGVMNPDILVCCEVWNHNAADVAARIEQALPSGAGEQWYAVKEDDGNVLCTRYPIVQSWRITPSFRNSAALLDLGPSASTDLLVVFSHWRCCTADANRQEEADAVVAFLRDAKTPGGIITLPDNTPILMSGDLNLVGWRQQLDTITTGDIQDEGTYGADAAPDWDGGDFATPHSRHADQRSAYTWFADYSSYYPGMLDWIFYTDSVLTLQHHAVMETRTMTATTLATYGLQQYDTTDASDHAARFADFSLGSPLSGVAPSVPTTGDWAQLLPNAPNPFNPATRLRFALERDGDVRLAVYDARGRLVRGFGRRTYTAGDHAVTWDGRDDAGRAAASGVYYVRLTGGAGTGRILATRAVTLLE